MFPVTVSLALLQPRINCSLLLMRINKQAKDLDLITYSMGKQMRTFLMIPKSSNSSLSTGGTSTDVPIPQASKRNTNNLAPLPLEASPPMQLDVYNDAHEHWFVRVFLLLVGFLHTKHHLSFQACGILLWSVQTIFILMAVIASDNPMPTTLGTTFTHLGLEDRFKLLVICPKCRSVCGPPHPTRKTSILALTSRSHPNLR
jgi:hypothetical protein